jgi:outer membrane protein W
MIAALLALALDLADPLPTRLLVQEEKEANGPDLPGLSIGLHVGWMEMKDAEDGEVFYGAQLRVYLLPFLALEGSVDVNKQEFIDDDVEVRTIPVQVSALIFPFPKMGAARPYALAGAGWYFQDVEFDNALESIDDDDDNTFGWHVGAGLEVLLGKILMIYADVRYIWLDDPEFDSVEIEEEEFDYWQVAAGIGLAF